MEQSSKNSEDQELTVRKKNSGCLWRHRAHRIMGIDKKTSRGPDVTKHAVHLCVHICSVGMAGKSSVDSPVE